MVSITAIQDEGLESFKDTEGGPVNFYDFDLLVTSWTVKALHEVSRSEKLI